MNLCPSEYKGFLIPVRTGENEKEQEQLSD